MSKKQPFHFNISSPDKVEWDVWHELMLNNDMNSSFFGFNAGHSAWGDILKILDEEIFTHSDLYKLELFGPATRINHSSWPTDIDEDGEFGQIGANLCSVNNFEILPDTYLFSKITNKNLPPKGSFGSLKLHDTNLSYFDVGGQFAKNLEKEGERASIDFVINSLRSTFGSNFDQFVIKADATSWGKNEFSLGSYSSAKPGKAHLREVLKSSVGDRIFFAGEATSINYGTVHGADLSGKEVADAAINISKF